MGKYDEVWKETIENLFEKFMFFYMPDLAANIDFSKGYEFLKQEFQTIEGKAKDTKRTVDKLIKVCLLNGEEQWILVHIEVQKAKKDDFSERMFRYFYRIYDKYNQKIVSLVIFTGESKSYPLKFDYNFYKTKLSYKYRSVKLTNYSERKLIKEKNPFALVTLAVKYSLKGKDDEEMRAKFTIKLIRLMKNRGYTDKDIISVFRFIDIMLEVKDIKLKKLIYEELQNFSKEAWKWYFQALKEML